MTQIGPYTVDPVGFGLMSFTWKAQEQWQPDEVSFEAIKTALENAKHKLLLNAGAFYGPQSDATANLKLLKRFFAKYPELKDKAVVNVKGGIVMSEYRAKGFAGFKISSQLENLRVELQEIRRDLGSDEGGIDLHFYEPCRRDSDLSPEQIIKNLHTLQKEGLFQHIALSEVGAATIEEAATTAKALGTSIASVEIEYSPWETSVETNGVLDVARKHNIAILAYSPVGQGLLGGEIKSRSDLPPGDLRLNLDRWNEENFPKNLEIADAFVKFAKAHSPPVTPGQLALAWLIKQGSSGSPVVPIPGTTKAKRVIENAGAGEITVSDENNKAIRDLVDSIGVSGLRGNAHMRVHHSL